MDKELTILIPTYNQTSLLRRCLDSLDKQNFKNFSIIIVDDKGAEDCQGAVKDFPNQDIRLIHNEKNLGAIGNMINCLTQNIKTEFIMCLHEDDLIHHQYLEYALNILKKNTDIAFVASSAYYFNPGETINQPQSINDDWIKYSPLNFVEFILNNNKFAFGSVIYRQKLIKPEFIKLDAYNVLFDRPFLAEILINSQNNAAILNNQFYYYQNHPYPDKRWQSLTMDNIFNLYSYYEKLAPKKGLAITSQYIFDFVNLENKKWLNIFKFVRRGQRVGLISWRRISWKFLGASLFTFIFGKKIYYQVFSWIKKITKQR